MSLMSHAVQHYLKLPAPETRSLRIERDLAVPMRDGVQLIADHWRPKNGPEGLPTALVRTTYEHRGLHGRLIARPLAERGFQVLSVAARDGWDPGVAADPHRRASEDGLDLITWILTQPWFGGAMVLAGLGRVDHTPWAVAAHAPPQLKAMAPVATASAMTKELMRRDIRVPASLVGGWYDASLPGQVRDFEALQEAGRHARLTIGPWTHDDAVGAAVSESLEFSLPLARGQVPAVRAPVRLYVMGEEAWRDFDTWPPPGYRPRRVHLGAGGTLGMKLREGAAGYRYDPDDPTPSFGGTGEFRGGKVDNTWLEARPDVLTFTTEVLTVDFEVAGHVKATVWFRSSLPSADVFVRLCDVDPQGRSWNVCDGLTAVTGATGLQPVEVELWPTAYRFKTGHRIRVQVSSGAFPRYHRNPDDPAHSHPADQEVHFDAEHPSTITLPLRTIA
ncbi:CocE/NonD family hydrolase [Glycomyces sp. A-F 0318]|uniref:CocE/NonD family hydrolase n=1 Tax=Glycomyces amatae TaxID=2881355 RepID=UPI001E648984|nr:CocE/NonD family hydrolase [Glycomyces amatae]MCD0445047.1 CocE/NonD family hydrolase [Glycomyces amatae]